jgi:hypothetical protein
MSDSDAPMLAKPQRQWYERTPQTEWEDAEEAAMQAAYTTKLGELCAHSMPIASYTADDQAHFSRAYGKWGPRNIAAYAKNWLVWDSMRMFMSLLADMPQRVQEARDYIFGPNNALCLESDEMAINCFKCYVLVSKWIQRHNHTPCVANL